jgi:GAF domain-containing protein
MVKGDSKLEQEELFQSIANTITATLNLPTCIWVLDEKAQALKIAGAVGLRPAYVKRAVLKLDEPSVTGVVLQTGQPLAVRNILEDERWKYRKEAKNRGWKSVLCVPIKVAGRTLGVVSIYTIVEREFNPSEQELLERYAALIGTSLENARRGEMLRRLFEVGQFVEESIAKSPEAVLRRIVKGACEVTDADCAALYPLDPYRKGFYDVDKIAAYGLRTKLRILATNRPREEDGTGAQIRRKGPLVVNDIGRERPDLLQDSFIAREGVRAFMGTALKIGEETLGILYVNFRRPHPFTQDEQDIIQLLSHQAAIAIYNSRLFEQTTRRADTLAQLSDISRSLLSMEDIPQSLDKALKQIASSAKKVLRADMVDLYPYIEETAEFKLPPILVGKRKQPLVPPVPTKIFSDDVIVKILEGDQPQYFEKAQEAPLLSGEFEIEREDVPEQRFVFREEIESSAAIPLKAAGETVGVMFVNYRSPQWFEPSQREHIELFANQAAVALYNARLFQQERQRAEAMDLLREVSAELSTTLDVERVLDRIVAGAMRLTGMESGVIYLIDETGQAVTRSFEHPKGFRHPPPRISKKTGLAWHVIETGEVLILPDVGQDKRVNPAILEKGVRSMIALPLKLEGKVVGVLFLNDLQSHRFTEEEQLLLSTLSDQATLAIRNARLFESAQRRLETLTILHSIGRSLVSELDLSQVLGVISESALEVLEADIVTLYQYFEDEDRFETPPVMTGSFINETPMRDKVHPDDIVVRIVRDGKSHFAEDAREEPLLSGPRTDGLDRPRFVEREGIKSSAGVLMKVEDGIVGVMFVNYRRPNTFGPEARYGIEIFANQAALAIRNARLFEQTKKQREERIEAIREMGFGITATTDLDELLEGILQRTIHLLGEASYGSIRLLDEKTGELVLRASHGKVVKEDFRRLGPGKGVMGWVAEHKEPVLIADVDKDERYVRFLEGTQSEMVVPMLSGDRLIGVLNVEHPQINAFDEDDLRMLQAVASQAVIAIENARLFQSSQSLAAQLEKLHEATASISEERDLEKVLLGILTSVNTILGEGTSSSINLYDKARDDLYQYRAAGPWREELLKTPPRPDGTGRHVIRTGKPIYIEDVRQPPHDHPNIRQEAIDRGVKSFAALPLKRGEDIVGIVFANLTREFHFSPEVRRVLELFANQAAIAIENARLYQDLERKITELEALSTLGAELSTVPLE